MAIFAEVGGAAARVDVFDMGEPALTVQPSRLRQTAVALHPAESPVIGRQRHRHPLTRVGAAQTLPQPVVVLRERANSPAGIKGLICIGFGHDAAEPLGGGGHKLRQPLRADGRHCLRIPAALLMQLGGEVGHRR